MGRHPIWDQLDAALEGVVSSEPVELTGSWLPAARRTYQRPKQLGSGDGPFVNVIDWRWRGHLSCATPIVAVTFFMTSAECRWYKSAPPDMQLEVGISFHAYADYLQDRATFAASVGGPAIGAAVSWQNDPAATCELAASSLRTARVETLARTEEAALAVLVLPAEAVKTGRHRLWRVRDTVASALPAQSRELLTRRRSGRFVVPSRFQEHSP